MLLVQAAFGRAISSYFVRVCWPCADCAPCTSVRRHQKRGKNHTNPQLTDARGCNFLAPLSSRPFLAVLVVPGFSNLPRSERLRREKEHASSRDSKPTLLVASDSTGLATAPALQHDTCCVNRNQKTDRRWNINRGFAHEELTLRLLLRVARTGRPPAFASPPVASPAFAASTPSWVSPKADGGAGTADTMGPPPPVPVGAGTSLPLPTALLGPTPAFPAAAATLPAATVVMLLEPTVLTVVPKRTGSF